MWRETSDNKANLDTNKDELKFFKSVDIRSCEMCMFHGIVYQAATPFFCLLLYNYNRWPPLNWEDDLHFFLEGPLGQLLRATIPDTNSNRIIGTLNPICILAWSQDLNPLWSDWFSWAIAIQRQNIFQNFWKTKVILLLLPS